MKNKYQLEKGKVLVLRTCSNDMTAYGGFKWPESGYVECHDWDEKPKCGNGLHGLLWGEGSASYLDLSYNAKWLVCEVDLEKIVWIDGNKVKFPNCNVIYCGDKGNSINLINEHAPHTLCVFSTLTGGDRSTLTGGDRSTLTGGNESTLTGGNRSTLTGGYESTLTGGDRSTLTGGNESTFIFKKYIKGFTRIFVFYVGENGVKPNTKYKLNDKNKIEEVK